MSPDRTTAVSAGRRWLGVELDEVSSIEKLVSAVAGGTAILVALFVCERVVEGGSPLLVASMGASAVLLFAVPHGQLSQPWPVLVGHITSAAIGVACAMAIGPTSLAAAAAVGLAIGAMHLLKSIHPPGGATALTAVLGGPAIVDMGFEFVLVPVTLNAALMVLLAVLFNNMFPWRRYPASLADRRRRPADPTEDAVDDPTHRAVLDALREVDSFIDITEDDLVRLHRRLTASEQRQGRRDTSAQDEEPRPNHP